MMRTTVIGFGSIGQRHARILQTMSDSVAVVSRRSSEWTPAYTSIQEMFKEYDPQYVVIANETAAHLETLIDIQNAGYKGKILIEKPLFRTFADLQHLKNSDTSNMYVAYNLRYHPVIAKLKQMLQSETIIQAHVYTGQYLPTWRPNVDYSTSYSASKVQGGGVIRDLSHELDYLLWLFGDWQSLVASGGKVSDLIIDSDDHFTSIFRMANQAHVVLHINYLERTPRRQITVNTLNGTITADLISGSIQSQQEQFSFQTARDDTYRAQHLDCMSPAPLHMCSFVAGCHVMQLIEAMEKSSDSKEWIHK
jgi:predicted dehydrogenase